MIYVREMTMPETCDVCRFSVCRPRVCADGYIVQCQAMHEGDDDEIGAEEGRRKRLDNCPLEEVKKDE